MRIAEPASRQVERGGQGGGVGESGARFRRFEESADLVRGSPCARRFASCMGMLAPGGVPLAEEAEGGKEGRRLARVGGMGETLIGVPDRGAAGQ